MGISADLIQFDIVGKEILDDLNDVSLYEFFPTEMHHLIFSDQIEIYDLEYYKELYNCPELRIHVHGCINDLILTKDYLPENPTDEEMDDWYARLIRVDNPKTKMKTCNAIRYNILGYIGGKEAFKENIFELYSSRDSFPYLWKIDDNILREKIYWVYDHKNKPFVYINLNY